MTKFTEKSLHSFAMAFFYSTTQAFVDRIGAIDTQIERLITMRNELNSRFQAFDTAYKLSIKSQHTKTIADLDAVRDHLAFVIESVASQGSGPPNSTAMSSTSTGAEYGRCSKTSSSAPTRPSWQKMPRSTICSSDLPSLPSRPTSRQWDSLNSTDSLPRPPAR